MPYSWRLVPIAGYRPGASLTFGGRRGEDVGAGGVLDPSVPSEFDLSARSAAGGLRPIARARRATREGLVSGGPANYKQRRVVYFLGAVAKPGEVVATVRKQGGGGDPVVPANQLSRNLVS